MRRENFPTATARTLIETSPATVNYNCIAWTLGDTATWWSSEEFYYWPPRVPKPMTKLENVVALYRREGFELCESAILEEGIEKVALYTTNGRFMHAALQLESGRWTSKFGPHEDAEHDSLEVLIGPELEQVTSILMRPRRTQSKSARP